MTYVWQTADLLTGATSPDRVLPHVPDSGNYKHDIKAAQTSSVKVHKDLLGPNGAWRNALKRVDTMVILHNPDAEWTDPDAILTGGWLNAIPAEYGQTVNITVGGINEWWRNHAVCDVYNGTITDPNTIYLYDGSTMQNTLHSLVRGAHSKVGIPAGAPTPPQILRNVDGVQDIAPQKIIKEEFQEFSENAIEVNPANYKTFYDVIEEARDETSKHGNEIMPKLVWLNSSKTLIGLDVKIGSDTNPHINFNQTKTIYLERDGDVQGYIDGSKDYHVINISLNQNGDGYGNRIIGQSTAGDDEEPADFTTKIVNAGPDVLMDIFYNPNVKRDSAFFNTELDLRLAAATRYPLTGTVTLIGDPAEWNNHLGKKLFIRESTTDANDPMKGFGMGEELRISDINVTPSETHKEAKIQVGFVIPAARYPRLPRELDPADPFQTNSKRPTTASPVIKGEPKNAPEKSSKNETPPTTDNGDGSGTQWGGVAEPDSARLATGGGYSLAIDGKGKLWGWGSNSYAYLGLGSYPEENGGAGGENGKDKYTTPQQIGSDSDWSAVYIYGGDPYAIKKNGDLYGWGFSGYIWGFDDNYNPIIKTQPTYMLSDVKKITTVPGAQYAYRVDGSITNLGGYDMREGQSLVKIEANGRSNYSQMYWAAIDTEGRLWEKRITNGQSATSPWLNNYPELRFKDISVSNGNTPYCAGIDKTTGQLYTWGVGYHGTEAGWSDQLEPLLFGIDIGAVHSFPRHTGNGRPNGTILYVRADNGELWAVGNNSPLINDWPEPIHYGIGTNFDWRTPHYLAMNAQNFLAIINNGELWVGGINYVGELGIGPVGRRSDNLFRVGTSDKWRSVHSLDSSFGGYSHSLAIHDNNMFATGDNEYGQLGLGEKTFLGFIKYENFDDQTSWTVQPTSKEPTS